MSKWDMVKLGSINNYQSKSVNPMIEPNGKFELYSVPSYENDYPEILTGADIGSTKQAVQEDDVLLCKINPRINRVWSVTRYTKYPLIASSEWIVIRNNDIFPNYLVWCLRSEYFRNLMTTNVTGIGGSLTRVQPKLLKEYLIPLPPFETQKHIAKTLDTAAELLTMRKQQLAELDNLIKSTFYDMFGDPVTNEKGWPVSKMGVVCSKITDGKHGDCNDEPASGYYFISAKDINNSMIRYNNARQIAKVDFEDANKRTKLCAGDLVVVNTGATIGKTAIVIDDLRTSRTTFQKSVAIIKVIPSKLLNLFLQYYIIIDRDNIYDSASGSAQKNWLLSQMRNYQIFLPPISVQKRFTDIVIKIEEQKTLVKKAIDETQYLFDSLMSEYFE